ncbi:hypothetical protein PoB_000335700 [Plakobranchus ocellatus]|uniref:Uncharacterized protein n=1 Tax=Plakobranchus ocellatus TaxID=259542 RepID=A0AAV3Y440_9GAST|nr:hypothetical protein PoB_000335700 [Plakobranchus ocellatus]
MDGDIGEGERNRAHETGEEGEKEKSEETDRNKYKFQVEHEAWQKKNMAEDRVRKSRGITIEREEAVPSREEALAAKEREEQQAADQKHREELEAANQILHQEIEKLEAALHKAESIEQQLSEKTRECEALTSKLTSALQQKAGLEKQVITAQAKEASLKAEVNELKVKVQETAKVSLHVKKECAYTCSKISNGLHVSR